MDRYQPRQGTPISSWRHIHYMQDATMRAFQSVLADYLSFSPSFFIDGAVLTQTPSGLDIVYTLTDGVVCLAGELVPLEGGTVTKALTQVVFIEVDDEPDDITPVINLDGQTDYVMRKRTARLKVANAYPTSYMPLTAPRKADLDLLRNRGRLVLKGGIIPYAGVLTVFDATGKGLPNTVAEGWAICNGLNGTVDLRGVVPFGASNVPSAGAGSLYAGVLNTTSPGEYHGADGKQLVADNLPEHTHEHTIAVVGGTGGDVVGGSGYQRYNITNFTQPNVTTNQPVDVRQAGLALVFIQSIV